MKTTPKNMSMSKTNKKVVIMLLAGIICLFSILLVLPSAKTSQKAQIIDYYSKYSKLKKPITKSVLENINEIVKRVGVDGALELVALIETKNQLNRGNCHTIMHLLGHQAYSSKLKTIPELLKRYGHLCQSGFPHGIEAQISLEETDSKLRNQKLKNFCVLYKSYFPVSSSCYHGVGHAFYQQLRDPQKALKVCDTLDGPSVDLRPCYQGIFSEFASDIRGIDGETGLPVPGQHRKIVNPERPLLYCSRFEEKYREACSFSMAIISISQKANVDDFSPCMYKEYSENEKELCIEYLAAVVAREKLNTSNSFSVPKTILSMDAPLQRAYIKGLFGAVNAYARDGRKKDWQGICNTMSNRLVIYCKDYASRGAFDYQNSKFIQ